MKIASRTALVLILLIGALWLAGDRAQGFSYFNYDGYDVVWADSTSLRFLSPGTFPEGSETELLILLSMNQWSTVWSGGFQYSYYSLEEDPEIDNYDGYSDTTAVPAEMLDPGVLGVTAMVNDGPAWFDMDILFSDYPDGVGWNMLTNPDCETVANPNLNGFCFYLVATHELGHAIGLGHEPIGDEPPGTTWFVTTMNPGYPAGGPVGQDNIIELHTDDRAGARYLYPGTPVSVVDLANASYCTAGPTLGKVVPLFVEPQVITPGGVLTAWSVIENFGTVSVLNVRQGFYISTDDVIDAGDMLMGDTRWDLSADNGLEFSVEVDIPDMPVGAYYFGSMLDDLGEIEEEYEDNNDAICCEPFVVEQGIPTFDPMSQRVIACDQPFVGPAPVVHFPINTAPITWSLDNPQPGMTIDETTGVITWPNPIKSAIEYHIDVRATNDAGTHKETLNLVVLQASPRTVPIPTQSVPCRTAYTGPTPILTAPDCMSPITNWSLLQGPSGMTIDSGSGIVSWPLVEADVSPVTITVQATNGVGTSTMSWDLIITNSGGDLNGNGVVGMEDVNPFVSVLLGLDPGSAYDIEQADLNCDDRVDGLDIQPFLDFLLVEGPVLGACCYSDGTCSVETAADCYSLGGSYRGDGTTCETSSCSGACCFYTGGCLDFTQDSCEIASGTFQGMGTLCSEVTCPSTGHGACCLPDETCELTTLSECIALGGAYQGTGLACEVVDCSTPIGACCHPDGSCSEGSADECATMGGTYLGNGIPCTSGTCLGACCYPAGGCLDLSEPNCGISGGDFQGHGTDCASTQCEVEPTGACCFANESCQSLTGSMCLNAGGSYQGDGSDCATTDCTAAAIGACCLPNETCIEVTAAACHLAGGVFIDEMTNCATTDCGLGDVGACYDPVDWSCFETSQNICVAMGGAFEGVDTTCAGTTAPEYLNRIDVPTAFWAPGAGETMADDLTLSGTARGLSYFELDVYGTGGGTYDVTVTFYDGCPGEGGVEILGTESTWTAVPADDYIYTLSADISANPIWIPGTVWMAVSFTSANAGWVTGGPAEIGFTEDYYAESNPWACDYWFGGPPNDYAGFVTAIQCVPIPDPIGACCLPDTSCMDGLTVAECDAQGGFYMGDNELCEEANCEDIQVGACCAVEDWSCSTTSSEECLASGGSYDGIGTNCITACPEYGNDIPTITLNYNPGVPMADDLILAGSARELVYFDISVYGGGGGAFDLATAFYDASPCSGGVQIPGTLVTGAGLPDNGEVLNLTVSLPTPVTLPDTVWLVVEFGTPYAGWIVAEEAESGSTAFTFAKAVWDEGSESWTWSCTEEIGGEDNPHGGFWAHLQCVEPGSSVRGAETREAGVTIRSTRPFDEATQFVPSVDSDDAQRGVTPLLLSPGAPPVKYGDGVGNPASMSSRKQVYRQDVSGIRPLSADARLRR